MANVDFEWHDGYSIGVEEIDVQHRRFLALIASAFKLATRKAGDPELTALLDELARYAPFHFGSEELLMRTYAYPKYEEQKRQHDRLLADVDARLKAVRAGSGDMVSLLQYLVKWFVDHDDLHDREFGEHVRGIRGAR